MRSLVSCFSTTGAKAQLWIWRVAFKRRGQPSTPREIESRAESALAGTALSSLGGWITLCEARNAFAYRPFVSTDAAVAAPGEVEIELGYAGFRQEGSRTAIVAPAVVGNFGVARNLEVSVARPRTGEARRHHVLCPLRWESKWIT